MIWPEEPAYKIPGHFSDMGLGPTLSGWRVEAPWEPIYKISGYLLPYLQKKRFVTFSPEKRVWLL